MLLFLKCEGLTDTLVNLQVKNFSKKVSFFFFGENAICAMGLLVICTSNLPGAMIALQWLFLPA